MSGGILSGGMQDNPYAQYQQMQANPFTRQIPGTEYLSGMNGQMGGGNMGGMPPMNAAPQEQQQEVPSDFAGVPPGLPNLPQDLQGFGFGETAPQMNINNKLQESLLQQLIQQLMSAQGGGNQCFGGI